MTDYAQIIAQTQLSAEDRASMIAEAFNATATKHGYTTFRLINTNRARDLHLRIIGTAAMQVDAAALLAEVAAAGDHPGLATTGMLYDKLASLAQQQSRNTQWLDDIKFSSSDLRRDFSIIVAAEKAMTGWANVNLLNTQGVLDQLGEDAGLVAKMSTARPLIEAQLDRIEDALYRVSQGSQFATYLKSGLSTKAAVIAPRIAKFGVRVPA